MVSHIYLSILHLTHDPTNQDGTNAQTLHSSLGLMAFSGAICSVAELLTGEYPWQALLGVSLIREYDYLADIEGKTPPQLKSTLYRNGPGLFERGGYRKQHILDDDGMIQAITLSDSKARYRNHFVQTPKYLHEKGSGRFLYPTWTTLAPGSGRTFPEPHHTLRQV